MENVKYIGCIKMILLEDAEKIRYDLYSKMKSISGNANHRNRRDTKTH